jgi:rare lipoprotein A
MSSEYSLFFADNGYMKRISLILVTLSFLAPLCAAQQFPPADLSSFRQEGIASWYGGEFNGRPTASGEIFNSSLYTAAHPTLPFGTMLTVTNLNNGRKVNVKVNDRGPFVSSRIIDLSQAAAQMLDMEKEGTAPVLIEATGAYSQAGDSAYWTETNSYALSRGGTSSANSQIVAPYPAYQNPQDPVIIQVQPAPQNPPSAQGAPQQQITQYFQQPVQPVQQQAPQQSPIQQIQPVQQVLPVQHVQPVIQPMRPLVQQVLVPPQQAQTVPQTQAPQAQPTPQPVQPQTIQPLQIQIPIEVKPLVSAESAAPASPTGAGVPSGTSPATPPANPAAVPPPITVILAPGSSAPELPPAQVRVKPNTIYRVQTGSFKEARNALAAFERLKEAGLNPVYERHGEFFRVVLSGIPAKDMAEILRKLQLAGFSDPLLREER